MKKFAFIFAAVAAFFVVSCTKESTPETPDTSAPAGMKLVTITASVDDVATKTSYTPDATDPTLLKFSWTKGDQISILASDNNFYTFTADQTGSSSIFTGMLPSDVGLGEYALYPASEVHYYDASAWQPYFGIDMYKDLSESFSADLPMTAKKGEGDAYSFKHATAALLFTFTNIPDGIETVEVSFENESLQFSGRHKAYYAEPWSLSFLETGNADEDRRFVRKVSVESNTAKVYLPFKGTLWGGYDNTINIVGYDADEKEYVLLKDQLMPGKDLALKTVGQVIPVAPLALPDNIDFATLNWDQAQISYVLPEDASSSRQVMRELKLIADDKYVYVKIRSSKAKFEETGSNYLGFYLYDKTTGTQGNGYWEWFQNAIGDVEYEGEHDGSFEAGTVNLNMTFNGNPILTMTYVSGDEVYWYMAFPRTAHELLLSSEKVYIAFILDKDWSQTGALPDKYDSMFEVTLP